MYWCKILSDGTLIDSGTLAGDLGGICNYNLHIWYTKLQSILEKISKSKVQKDYAGLNSFRKMVNVDAHLYIAGLKFTFMTVCDILIRYVTYINMARLFCIESTAWVKESFARLLQTAQLQRPVVEASMHILQTLGRIFGIIIKFKLLSMYCHVKKL